MRARIASNLIERYREFWLDDGDFYPYYQDPGFVKLAEQISGQEVELIFIGPDAFEAKDGSYWLPNCCWEEVIVT